MTKYVLASAALKFFSLTRTTRWFYRNILGNYFGQKRRLKNALTPAYIQRAKLFLSLCKKNNAIQDGMRLIEIGTGWVHFYAIFIRLFFDVKITLVDVCDNRQLDALKKCFNELDAIIDSSFDLNTEECTRAHRLITAIIKAHSFDELYDLLDFDYFVEAEGSLSSFPAQCADLVFSFDVLEHVAKNTVPLRISEQIRLLKSGGFLIHLIGIDDHLTHYDRSMSPKNYLRYPNWLWKVAFQNKLQYFNRIQPSEWERLFQASGAHVVDVQKETCSVEGLKVHREFKNLDLQDISSTTLIIVLNTPDCII